MAPLFAAKKKKHEPQEYHDRLQTEIDIIKTMGFRVSPDEVMDVIFASGEVAEAIVGAEEDEARGALIVAYVVLSPSGTLEKLQRFCRTELPRYMQPGTTSGKFDLRAAQAAGTTT